MEASIVGEHSFQSLDALLVVLLERSEETLLPEIAAVFGREKLLKFLDIFSGATVQVPSRKILEEAARDVDVYLMLSKSESKEVLSSLSVKYELSESTLLRIYRRVRDLMAASCSVVGDGDDSVDGL